MLVRLIRGKSCQRPQQMGQDFPRGVLVTHLAVPRWPMANSDASGAADIGSISESARCWGISCRSCPAPTHHSKRSLLFSTPTFLIGCLGPSIGIGGRLTAPPLPHHLAYGSVPRRFDRVKLLRRHKAGEVRDRRKCGCAGPAGPPGDLTYARTPLANRPRPPHGTSKRLGGAVP